MSYNPSNPNGQATSANSAPVVLASDQSAIPITDNAGSITVDGSVTVSGTVTANAGTGTMNVSVQNASIPVTDNGGSLTVDGSVSVSNFPATQAVSATNLDIRDLTATDVVTVTGGAGQTADVKVTLDSEQVAISNFPATQTVSGTVTVQDGGGSITVDGTVTVTDGLNVEGDVAHDTADSGNPVKIGFQAEASMPAAVATGDRSNGISDVYGRQLISHIDPGMQVWKAANPTSQQTGIDLWTPSSGKKIAITYLAVSSYATTAGRVILWLGASADTTYTAGTDQLVWAGSFAPSANAKPGAIISIPNGIFAVTADHRLKITTDAAISLDITVYGYEF